VNPTGSHGKHDSFARLRQTWDFYFPKIAQVDLLRESNKFPWQA
jgi:hypothetical protein